MKDHNTPITGINPESAYREQIELVSELKDLWALVEVSRQAVTYVKVSDIESSEMVLMMASSRLYDLLQQQEKREKALELLAYPWKAEDDGGAA